MDAALPLPWVLLRHEGSAEGDHFDWMLQPPGPAETSLITFRVLARVDQLDAGEFEATRLADHRAAYLTYEGPLSGGRGRVTRVASGRWRPAAVSGQEIRGLFGGLSGSQTALRRFRGSVRSGSAWAFQVEPAD